MTQSMKLFYSSASPFVRKVVMTGLIKGLDGQIEKVSTDATKGDATLNAANPLGRLPCLIADGVALHDSHVICEYLDSIGSGPVLFPRSGPERWRVLTLASLADGITEAALSCVYERRYRPENMVVQSWLDRQWGKINASLDDVEKQASKWGTTPDYAFVTMISALGYLDFRHGTAWQATRPNLVAWRDRFTAAIPAAAKTAPPVG